MKNKKLLAGMLATVLSVSMICSNVSIAQAQETTQVNEATTEAGEKIIKNDGTGIPDTNLYKAILEAADSNSDGDLTVSEAESLTSLSVSDVHINDLTGIEFCKNLPRLNLDGKNISDISALADLTELEYLSLNDNNISDISALADLTKLEYLSLNDNNISDISALATLQNLGVLSLSYNALNEDAMDTIQNLKSLNQLDLAGNQLTNEDVAKLSNLTSLDSLNLSDNQINDIRAFANMANLYSIDISKNQISDISVLSEIPDLANIFAAHNQITDISALSHKELWVMDLSYNQISTIKDLYLRVKWELHLQHNQLEALDAEYIYSDLVDMSHNKIKKIEVGSLVSKSIYLSHNEIRDLNGIENFSGLNMEGIIGRLDLSNNQIEDVSPLAKIDLYTLDLSNNKIRDISALNGLKENGCNIITDGNPIGEPEEPQEPEQPEGDKPSDEEKPSEPTEPEKPSEEQKPSEPSEPVYTPDDFAELLEKQDIVIKPNDYVTITFSKGSEINDTTGKTEYNFTTTVTTDYTNAKLPAFITQNSFITKISYTYSGVLPATANIEISVGKDYAGKEVFYFLLNEDGTFNKNEVQKVKVNENGVITVKQEHCSDYVVTTVNPETLYAATQTPNEDPTPTDTDSKESPKTGDNILFGVWCTVILSGILTVVAYKRKQA